MTGPGGRNAIAIVHASVIVSGALDPGLGNITLSRVGATSSGACDQQPTGWGHVAEW
jgi:hypothetical protein